MRILRLPKVIAITGLSRASIYRYMNEKTFPQAIKLGSRSVGWLEHEVNEWLEARISSRDAA